MTSRPRSRLRRLLRRRGRAIGIGVTLVVVFAAALTYWGRSADLHTGEARADQLAPPGKVAVPLPVSLGVAPASGTPTSGTPSSGSGGGLSLHPLPGPSVSADIRSGAQGTHTVKLYASSDQEILRLSYEVRGAKPETVKRSYVRSPLTVTVTGRGDGLLAQIGVQASAHATRVTCRITVDGVVTALHTSKGAYAVSVCIG